MTAALKVGTIEPYLHHSTTHTLPRRHRKWVVTDPSNCFEADAVVSVEPTIINRLVTGRSPLPMTHHLIEDTQ